MTTAERSNYNGLSSGNHTSPSVGFYVLSPLCILHSDYFRFIHQPFQGQREKSNAFSNAGGLGSVFFCLFMFFIPLTLQLETDSQRSEHPVFVGQRWSWAGC